MNRSALIGIGPLYDSNLKKIYIYIVFILNLYLLTDSEDSLNYSFERKHLEAIVSNLIVV